MNVLQINVVYNKGSTGKIVYDIHRNLVDNGIDSVVCYGRGLEINEQGIYKTAPEIVMKLQSLRSKLTGYNYAGCLLSTHNLINIIKKENPDVVHLHCLNGYFVNIYKLIRFLKNNNIKTVLTLHAEFMYTAGCGYALECEQWKTGCCIDQICPEFNKQRPKSWLFNRCNREWNMMKQVFSGFDNLTICPVSDWVKSRAMQSPFMSDKKIITVTNGLDTDIFKPTAFEKLKQKCKLNNEKIILHVTPSFLSPIKGGKFVLEIANRFINDNVKIIIVGFNGNTDDLPSNVIPVLHTSNQKELAAYYSMADVTLLTSKKETFSMICAESLCCGTPIIGFEAGAPETISISEYSQFVEYGNVNKLEDVIRAWLGQKEILGNEISNKAKEIYSREVMFEKYFKIYKDED